MKKVWIIASALLLASVAGFAETPPPLSPQALVAILGQPAGSCDSQPSQVVLAGAGLEKALCSATASCGTYTISCQGNNSTTSCTAVDRNCTNGQTGYVTCDGVTTTCGTCGTTTDWCAQCNATGACFACCRCAGGTGCVRACSDPIEPYQ